MFIQFLKDDSSGEIPVLRSVSGIEVLHCPVNYGFTFRMTEEQKKEASEEYDRMLDRAIETDAFLIVLDEIIHALNAGMFEKKKLQKILEKQ